jgi:general stress protein 26
MTSRYTATLLLCLAVLAAPAAAGQAAPSEKPTREEIVSAARAIIGKARYATFVTLDASGHPQARIVDPFEPEADLAIWIATNARSRKVGQVAASSKATLLYFDAASQSYVTVIGNATLVRDAAEKAKRWKEEWAAFYKDRNKGDDYVLIRIAPTRLEVVSEALGMRNDPETWRPVILELK